MTASGFVYFVRAGDLVKIGFSRDPQKRLDHFRCLLPAITVLGTHPGTMADERTLHKIFEKQRVSGEWFKHNINLDEAAKTGLTEKLRALAPPFEVFTVAEIMGGWPTDADFARDIGLKHPSHAQTMKVRGSIPAAYWSRIVAAATARGIKGVTLEALAEIAARTADSPTTVPDDVPPAPKTAVAK